MKAIDFQTPIILENERIRLEPLTHEHHTDLLPIGLKTPDLLKYSPSEIGSHEKLTTYLDTVLTMREEGRRYALVIFDKTLNRYVGSSSYHNISVKDSRLEIGWTWIDPEFQGSKINENIKYLMLEYAFETLGAIRVEFCVHSKNLRSQGAMKKIGGVLEGTLRSHTKMLDGSRRDTLMYSILRNEWDTTIKHRLQATITN